MTKTKTPKTASSTDRATAYAPRTWFEGRVVGAACAERLPPASGRPEARGRRGLVLGPRRRANALGLFRGRAEAARDSSRGSRSSSTRRRPSIGSLFGWKRADGRRRFRRAYIEEGKGNGKSPFGWRVGLYGLAADGEAGAQIYAAAAKKEQAAILFQDAVQDGRRSPALTSGSKFSGGPGREFNIASPFGDRSSGRSQRTPARPARARATLRALRRGPRTPRPQDHGDAGARLQVPPPAAAVDDHQLRVGSQLGLLGRTPARVKVAAGTRRRTTFTYVGEVLDDTTFSFVCALDKDDDPLTDPSCWVKANPLLGDDHRGVPGRDRRAGQGDARQAQRHPAASLLRLDRCRRGLDRPRDAGVGAGRLRPAGVRRRADLARHRPQSGTGT
jgi:hypothetical protein